MELEEIRRFFAEEIRMVANLRTEALVQALATVPREHYLGPGPWQIAIPDTRGLGGGGLKMGTTYRPTEDADPRHLYHNVLIAIDPDRQLNNGHPSTLASFLDALELKAGDRVVHVGCGVGYYTALIAEVVGPRGQVTGIEIDPALASRARQNLAHLDQVEVVQADGGEYPVEPTDAVLINAGATHLRPAWLDHLRPGGRLLAPLTFSTDADGTGAGLMFKVTFEGPGHAARPLSQIMIFPCLGSRDEAANQRLLEALRRPTVGSVQSLRRDAHDRGDTCWLHADGCCLSTLPVDRSS